MGCEAQLNCWAPEVLMRNQSRQQLKRQALLAERAQVMRHCGTETEQALWRCLSGKQLGVAFHLCELRNGVAYNCKKNAPATWNGHPQPQRVSVGVGDAGESRSTALLLLLRVERVLVIYVICVGLKCFGRRGLVAFACVLPPLVFCAFLGGRVGHPALLLSLVNIELRSWHASARP